MSSFKSLQKQAMKLQKSFTSSSGGEPEFNAYKTFARRLGAGVIDSAILLLPTLFFVYTLKFNHVEAYFYWASIIAQALTIWFNVYCVARFGQTPGKRCYNLKVTMFGPDGAKPNWAAAIKREVINLSAVALNGVIIIVFAAQGQLNLLNVISEQHVVDPFINTISMIISLLYFLEILTALANPQRRSFHDFVAKTVVVRSPFKNMILPTIATSLAVGIFIGYLSLVAEIQKM